MTTATLSPESIVAELFEYAEPPRWIGTSEEKYEHGTVTRDDWRLTIRRKGGFSEKTMTLDYHTGSGHRRKIEATSRDNVSWWISRNKHKLPVGYSPYGHSNDDVKRMP